MKKEEFIQYVEGIADILDIAGLNKLSAVLDEIIGKANEIEVTVYNYPYRQPYWYNTGSPYWYSTFTAGEQTEIQPTTIATWEGQSNSNTSNWCVKNLNNGDFEIVKN